MPLESSRTLLPTLMVVLDRNPSAFARSNRGCTPATYSSNCETRIHRGSTATSAMKLTSLMSSSRCRQGSRPKTLSVPSYGVRPTIAFRAVVLPAPFGPIRPRMRPSSTRKSTPSSAIVLPNTFRRPRASMHVIRSAFLLLHFCFLPAVRVVVKQIFRFQTEPQHGFANPGPVFGQEFLALRFEQRIPCVSLDEHSEPPPGLDESFVHELLISLQDCQWIEPIVRCHGSHRGQRIAFFENSVKDHHDDAIAKLAVNRLAVIPLTIHESY